MRAVIKTCQKEKKRYESTVNSIQFTLEEIIKSWLEDFMSLSTNGHTVYMRNRTQRLNRCS
jgi:hypothetical protein